MAWPHAEAAYVRQNILTIKGDRQDFLEKPGEALHREREAPREFNANDLASIVL